MNILEQAKWISADFGEVCPIYKKEFAAAKPVKKATLTITAFGFYIAEINGERVGDYIFAPGWTSYDFRLQYQEYDVTAMLSDKNELRVKHGKGWYDSPLMGKPDKFHKYDKAILCALEIEYADGTSEQIFSDDSFVAAESKIRFSEIYDGETFDARVESENWTAVKERYFPHGLLIPQQGDKIVEVERLKAISTFTTPAGEVVIDFGQNLTGYVNFLPTGKSGDVLELSHSEILDKDGNFYTENLRSAKAKITYICNGADDWYTPNFSFQGFRYIRLDKWSGDVNLDNFVAIVVHSDMKRTGHFECSNPKINKLFENIIWGQKGNFLDVPTDCPQRDERLGWTGDAQVFVRTASYNYDVERFFDKWLSDVAADQRPDGGIPSVIPSPWPLIGLDWYHSSAAWGDAAVICPWQIYLTYGNPAILEKQFDCAKNWVEYQRKAGSSEFLWDDGPHFADWLGIDSEPGEYRGATDQYLIATAFFAYSTELLVKSGKVLGKDMSEYETLYNGIVAAFREKYMPNGKLSSNTQTAHVLALYFNLTTDKAATAKSLADLVISSGTQLMTGFVGTPYLLHALSDNGYTELAYSLLLREDFPSWLYSVNQGATTIWEHWDGMNENGEMWSADMNSFNHYAYGAVADWMYGVCCGINIDESRPAFKHIIFKPQFDTRLDYAKASIDTRNGKVAASWKRDGGKVEYSISVPNGCTASVHLNGKVEEIGAGEFAFEV